MTEGEAQSVQPAAGSRTASTRERILATAERLFARDGIHAVTLRQIGRAAGQRNVAAVQYHFGGKPGLLTAIVQRHQQEIDAERRQMLDADERGGRSHDLDALLRVLVAPLSRKLDDPSGRAYLQIQAQRHPDERMLPATRLMVLRFQRALGESGGESRTGGESDPLRNRFAFLLLFQALAERAREESAEARTEGPAALPRPEFVASLERALRGIYRGA